MRFGQKREFSFKKSSYLLTKKTEHELYAILFIKLERMILTTTFLLDVTHFTVFFLSELVPNLNSRSCYPIIPAAFYYDAHTLIVQKC